jgi:hypothetical protein
MGGLDYKLVKSLIESIQQIPGVFVVHAEFAGGRNGTSFLPQGSPPDSP